MEVYKDGGSAQCSQTDKRGRTDGGGESAV